MENEEVKPLRGYSEEPIFYVYVHKKPGTNEVFYVGKGKKNRAYTTKSRNNHWSNVVNKYGGFDVEVIKSDMTEKESFEFEKKIIQEIGIENLTNQTLGGISTTGMVHSEATRKLQSDLMKKKLEENPEMQERLNAVIKTLHDKQRNDPSYREMMSKKLLEIRCEKLVVNKSFVFKSKKEYCDLVGTHHSILLKAKSSSNKFNFEFYISNGVFLEEYQEDKHSHIPFWKGEEIKKLDFDCLPRSKAVVMDDKVVFLSMNEASIFCKGKTIEATADFITKNMKKGKQAMGHSWRIASNEEIKKEIMNRLDELCNKT